MATTLKSAERRRGAIWFCALVLALSPLTAAADAREVHLAQTGARLTPAQWGAVLAAGHHDKANYDYAVEDIAQRIRGNGVTHIHKLTSIRQQAAQSGAAIATDAELRAAFGRVRGAQTAACFFFISSHANRKGIYLALDSGDKFLTASELDRLLTDACPNRPQVIILSGCHSGAMITSSMKRDPNRIILASASPSTVSYGATTSERHLNFERCLFKAFDAGATTWRELFTNALPCVAEREDWLRVPHSKPEAFFGSAVTNLRIPSR